MPRAEAKRRRVVPVRLSSPSCFLSSACPCSSPHHHAGRGVRGAAAPSGGAGAALGSVAYAHGVYVTVWTP
jgi:hypothetical protein